MIARSHPTWGKTAELSGSVSRADVDSPENFPTALDGPPGLGGRVTPRIEAGLKLASIKGDSDIWIRLLP